jgi:hypothetical protein
MSEKKEIDPQEILKIGKKEIKNATASRVDRIGKHYYDMLFELGFEEEAEKLYQFYVTVWS